MQVRFAFHFFLFFLVAAPVSVAAPPEEESPLDVEELMRDVQRVHFMDTAAWSRFQFRRQVLKQRLNRAGEVEKAKLYEFQVTPVPGGFDEELVSLDGHPPTRREVRQHRKEARFSRRYEAARSGPGGDDDSPLRLLLHRSSYQLSGRESVNGIECYRLDFSSEEKSGRSGLRQRIAQAMAGSLWIAADGHHLVRARARTVRPVSIAMSLAKVYSMEIELDSVPVMPGLWLPERLEVQTEARVSWWPIRRRSIFLYSNFHPVRGGPAEGGGVGLAGSP